MQIINDKCENVPTCDVYNIRLLFVLSLTNYYRQTVNGHDEAVPREFKAASHHISLSFASIKVPVIHPRCWHLAQSAEEQGHLYLIKNVTNCK
jgi:hypothetical protein